jgi:hypothetical protein
MGQIEDGNLQRYYGNLTRAWLIELRLYPTQIKTGIWHYSRYDYILSSVIRVSNPPRYFIYVEMLVESASYLRFTGQQLKRKTFKVPCISVHCSHLACNTGRELGMLFYFFTHELNVGFTQVCFHNCVVVLQDRETFS